MPVFGKRSLENLSSVRSSLRQVLDEAVKTAAVGQDFTVICGHRGKEDQEKALAAGNSKAHYGQSPHNKSPSCAIDFIPYPFNGWEDAAAFAAVAAHIKATAQSLCVAVTWGGDWKMNDNGHIELTNWRSL
jgi:peptidoglycan LD-endopeptidase CwlK